MAVQSPSRKPSRKALDSKAPSQAQRDQAKLRRETKRSGLPLTDTPLTPFVQAFCREYVRTNLLEDSHSTAETMTGVPLDLAGFDVHVEMGTREVKGRTLTTKTRTITDPATGAEVCIGTIRAARAAQLYHMPEVQAEIRRLRGEAAANIQVTAHTIATKLALIHDHAIKAGQLQVAANCAAMEAKMFGVEAGPGNGGEAPPSSAVVEIRFRDYSGEPAPRED